MRTEYRIFGGVATFFVVATVVYGWWTWGETGQIEWIGTMALLLSFGLTGMIAWYFWVVSRRIEPRPEDRPEAEIADAAGEVGFFSPGSYFPVGVAAAAAVTGVGVAFWQWWLMALGVIAVIVTVAGLLFEYQTGTRRTE